MLVINDTSDRATTKYDAASGCVFQRTGTQFTAAQRCKPCSKRVTALVTCPDGKRRTLEEAGYIESQATPQSVVLALVMSARRRAADGGPERSCVPEHFAPSRPSGSNVSTAVSEAEGGFPASHAHAGARVVMYYVCGYDAPGDSVCGMRMAVSGATTSRAS